jgi:outer membrane protein OmpA-like peptidoglycan-associated protein
MRNQLILAGAVAVMLPLLHPVDAATPQQSSFQIAQQMLAQRPDAEERKQRQQQRQDQRKEQRQQQKQQSQPQRPAVQPPRPAAQERRQERREDARDRQKQKQPAAQQQQKQPAAREQRQERREDARDRQKQKQPAAQQQQKQPAAREQRQERREDVRERRQQQRQDKGPERREDVRERRQKQREDVGERREDRREDAQRARRLDELRKERRESREGKRTVIREPGRTIIREGGRTIIRHSEVDRFRRSGARNVRVERRGNETRTIVERPGGIRIITITDRDGRLIRRIRRHPDGREVVIIDNRPRRGGAFGFFLDIAPPVIRIPRARYIVEAAGAPPALLYDTLIAPPAAPIERAYALDEIRYTANLRDRMPRIDLDTVTFETGSWEVTSAEAARLEPIAQAMLKAIDQNPDEVFLIEGHTDAAGDELDNLSLSDRRAEAVAIVLSEQFQVPPENLTTQGYGEQYLKVNTEGPERANRRVTVRRITPLLAGEGGPKSPG